MKTYLILFSLAVIILFVNSCKHDPVDGPPSAPNYYRPDTLPKDTIETDSSGQMLPATIPAFDTVHIDTTVHNVKDSVCFESEILPFLQSSCAKSGCHNAASHRAGINLSTYQSTVSENLNSLRQSMTASGNDRMPPSPAPALTSAQIALFQKWIDEGAKSNIDCFTDSCNLVNVTYNLTVKPILQNNCVSCHSAANASGGVNLSDYTHTKTQADNGKLVGTIKRLSGYSPMPPSTTLNACSVSQIETWVNNGAPNN